jgi:hypothetical protein
MAWPRALLLLLALTACTPGSPPTATRTSPSAGPRVTVAPSPTPSLDAASPDPAPGYRPLPGGASLTGFVPTSVSFVSARTGWFLGSEPCGRDVCGVLLQTRDGGRSFRRLVPPPVKVADVRFADDNEGWAFGNGRFDTQDNPGLWRTHDGGRHWKKALSNPVPALEVGGGSVWAIVLDLGGTFPQVFRGSTGSDSLRLVTQAGNRTALLTLGRGTVYVVAEQGAGPIGTTLLVIDPDGASHRYPGPCQGSAYSLQVAASPSGRLTAICSGEPSAGSQLKASYVSTSGGRTWARQPDPPGGGYTGAFEGSITATRTSVFYSGGRSALFRRLGQGPWRAMLVDEDGTGFRFVGMTDDRHGVALGERAGWMTSDGGTTWRRLRFS